MDSTKRHSLSRSRPHAQPAEHHSPRAEEGGGEGHNPTPVTRRAQNEPTARAKAPQRAPSCYNLLSLQLRRKIRADLPRRATKSRIGPQSARRAQNEPNFA